MIKWIASLFHRCKHENKTNTEQWRREGHNMYTRWKITCNDCGYTTYTEETHALR